MSRGVLLIGAAVAALLAAFASGYGPHRDELYFLAAGRHLAWSYADQGPVTPLIARAMSELSSSLTVIRLPSALAAGTTVVLTGALAFELGGRPRAQLVAAGCMAVASMTLVTGHLLSTSTFDLLVWTAVTWLVVRALRTGDRRLWPVAGVVLGLGLLNKPLPAFLAVGLLAGVVIAGPRSLLRDRWVWAGAAIAALLWLPWVLWQADHGWPQLDVSRAIARGESASSEPWWAIVPFQLLLVSPVLAPVWIAGLVRLARDPRLRFLVWTWLVLAVVFMASGGKPYYLAGLLPVLLAAGSLTVDAWLAGARVRSALLVGAIAISGVVSAVVALPVVPADSADAVVEVNPDAGETIGWPELVRTVARIRGRTGAVVFTRNYGEAGAVERYGPAYGITEAYSGHNAYADWSPPPDGAAPVVVVGGSQARADRHFRGCRLAARIRNADGIENDEDGAPVLLCEAPRRPWSEEWPSLRHLG